MTKMAKLTNIIAGTLIPVALAFSGCTIRIGGTEPADLSKSCYFNDIEKSAENSVEKYSQTFNISDLGNAVDAYGSIGYLNEMDEVIRKKPSDNNSHYNDKYADRPPKYIFHRISIS